MKKINSTLGFIFTSDLQKVLLIEKQKPEFHRGLLNGLGGKVEQNEDEAACIVREVREEAGLETLTTDWQKVGVLTWTQWQVSIFTGIYHGKETDLNLTEDLVVDWFFVEKLPRNCVTNLYWIIPYCVDILKTKQNIQIHITYES